MLPTPRRKSHLPRRAPEAGGGHGGAGRPGGRRKERRRGGGRGPEDRGEGCSAPRAPPAPSRKPHPRRRPAGPQPATPFRQAAPGRGRTRGAAPEGAGGARGVGVWDRLARQSRRGARLPVPPPPPGPAHPPGPAPWRTACAGAVGGAARWGALGGRGRRAGRGSGEEGAGHGGADKDSGSPPLKTRVREIPGDGSSEEVPLQG